MGIIPTSLPTNYQGSNPSHIQHQPDHVPSAVPPPSSLPLPNMQQTLPPLYSVNTGDFASPTTSHFPPQHQRYSSPFDASPATQASTVYRPHSYFRQQQSGSQQDRKSADIASEIPEGCEASEGPPLSSSKSTMPDQSNGSSSRRRNSPSEACNVASSPALRSPRTASLYPMFDDRQGGVEHHAPVQGDGIRWKSSSAVTRGRRNSGANNANNSNYMDAAHPAPKRSHPHSSCSSDDPPPKSRPKKGRKTKKRKHGHQTSAADTASGSPRKEMQSAPPSALDLPKKVEPLERKLQAMRVGFYDLAKKRESLLAPSSGASTPGQGYDDDIGPSRYIRRGSESSANSVDSNLSAFRERFSSSSGSEPASADGELISQYRLIFIPDFSLVRMESTRSHFRGFVPHTNQS